MNNQNNQDNKGTIIGFIFIIIVSVFIFSMCSDSGSSSSRSSSSKSGFVGSDGEYHSYVPEFGDDVNNWMEENW